MRIPLLYRWFQRHQRPAMININPNEDELCRFAHWYLTSGDPEAIRIYPPLENTYNFELEGVTGITIYRKENFQVELFIAKPNTIVPQHLHPNVDSFEVALHGVKFTHSGAVRLGFREALEEKDGKPAHSYTVIRVKPHHMHGGMSSERGGSFLSIQRWLNGSLPTTVSADWYGGTMGDGHKKQISQQENLKCP